MNVFGYLTVDFLLKLRHHQMSLQVKTLYDVLESSARQYSGRIALAMVDGTAITYADFRNRTRELSGYLRGRGINPGDQVALLGENSPNWGIAYFSIVTMGAVAVPILPDFHPDDIAQIIRHAQVSGIFVSRRLFSKVGGLGGNERALIILLDDLTVVPQEAVESDLRDPGVRRESATSGARSITGTGIEPAITPSQDDLASIVYTSGTMGYSKGVMLTHGNLVSDAKATVEIVDVNQDDRLLSILPLSHTYECTLGLITPIMSGASVYYMDKPPTAAVLLPSLEKVKPTVMLSVPLIIEKIYKSKILPQLTSNLFLRGLHSLPVSRKILHMIAGKRLLKIFGGKLRIFAIGGAPLAPEVELFLKEGRFPYAIGYGLTETAPLIAGANPERTRYRSTGPALPGTLIRIANSAPGTGEGEVQVKGPTVMRGYYKDPERTREVFTEDGWLKTGDLGVFDDDGYLYIKGRQKNMILGPSGKNIYPEEIESIINEFEPVDESVVYGHENRLVALVHLDYEKLQRAFHSLGETDLRKVMNEKLADLHKQINARVPLYARIHKLIEHAEPFQKTPTQKIKRHLYVP